MDTPTPDDDLTYDQRVAREIEKTRLDREAIRSEFANADPDDPQTAKKAREHVTALVPDAIEQFRNLMFFAESESVRANLSKFVLTTAMSVAKETGDHDSLNSLLTRLAKNDPVEDEVEQ